MTAPLPQCRKGHVLSLDNIYQRRDGALACKTCLRASNEAYRKRYFVGDGGGSACALSEDASRRTGLAAVNKAFVGALRRYAINNSDPSAALIRATMLVNETPGGRDAPHSEGA